MSIETNVSKINDKVCPHCKAEAVGYSVNHQHCNGYFNELKEFKCGLSIRFSPNFMQCLEEGYCSKDPVVERIVQMRKNAVGVLTQFIGTLDIDTKFRDDLLNIVKTVRTS